MQMRNTYPIAGVPPVYYVSDSPSTLDLAASPSPTRRRPLPMRLNDHRRSSERGAAAASGARTTPMVRPSPPPSFPPHLFPTEMSYSHACARARRTSPASLPSATAFLSRPNDARRRARKICAPAAPASSPFTTSAILGYDQHRPGLRSPRDPAGHLTRRGRR